MGAFYRALDPMCLNSFMNRKLPGCTRLILVSVESYTGYSTKTIAIESTGAVVS